MSGTVPADVRWITAPRLEVVVRLEESPVVRLLAGSLEDQRRLELYLSEPGTRRRLAEAIESLLAEWGA